MKMSKEEYQELPVVESEHNRCLSCDQSFANILRYRIHIKKSHEGVEPKANVDPENFCSADEFVCLICIKKYKHRRLLKNHIMRVHFGLNVGAETIEEVRIDEK